MRRLVVLTGSTVDHLARQLEIDEVELFPK
jgi:hypothetical protein